MKVLMLTLVSGCGMILNGNGDLRTEAVAVDHAFSKVEFRCELPGSISIGPASVTLRADTNLLDEYDLFVERDTLVVSHKHDHWQVRPSRGSLVTIVVPDLSGVELSGSGDVEMRLPNARDLALEVSGSGQLSVDGSGASLTARISGSGKIDAEAFSVPVADLEISGSGNISATVTSEVTSARISGSGSIDLYGGAAVTPQISGSGRVKIH